MKNEVMLMCLIIVCCLVVAVGILSFLIRYIRGSVNGGSLAEEPDENPREGSEGIKSLSPEDAVPEYGEYSEEVEDFYRDGDFIYTEFEPYYRVDVKAVGCRCTDLYYMQDNQGDYIYLVPEEGRELPADVDVTGCQYDYNPQAGYLYLYPAYDDVKVRIECAYLWCLLENSESSDCPIRYRVYGKEEDTMLDPGESVELSALEVEVRHDAYSWKYSVNGESTDWIENTCPVTFEEEEGEVRHIVFVTSDN